MGVIDYDKEKLSNTWNGEGFKGAAGGDTGSHAGAGAGVPGNAAPTANEALRRELAYGHVQTQSSRSGDTYSFSFTNDQSKNMARERLAATGQVENGVVYTGVLAEWCNAVPGKEKSRSKLAFFLAVLPFALIALIVVFQLFVVKIMPVFAPVK